MTEIKISMGDEAYGCVAPARQDRFEARAQGTGTAHVAAVDPETARQIRQDLRTAADAVRGERGPGLSKRRRAIDRAADRITNKLTAAGEGDNEQAEALPEWPFSPRGIISKGGKTTAADADPSWVMEPKLDGWRGVAFIGETVRIFAGSGREITDRVPHICDEMARTFPKGTVLDGELCVLTDGDQPDDWGGIQSILGSKAERYMIYRERASFVGFDVIATDYNDIRWSPFSARREDLEWLFADGGERRHTAIIPQMAVSAEVHDALLAQGYEGTMVKDPGAPYASGKRGRGIKKIKPQDDADVVVTGFTEGRNGFTGYVGAIEFEGTIDGEFVTGQCSGMTWAQRVEFTAHPEEWVGRVIEIAHHGRMPSGGIRHPQFKRVRDDKEAEECR